MAPTPIGCTSQTRRSRCANSTYPLRRLYTFSFPFPLYLHLVIRTAFIGPSLRHFPTLLRRPLKDVFHRRKTTPPNSRTPPSPPPPLSSPRSSSRQSQQATPRVRPRRYPRSHPSDFSLPHHRLSRDPLTLNLMNRKEDPDEPENGEDATSAADAQWLTESDTDEHRLYRL